MWPFSSRKDEHEEVDRLRTEFNGRIQTLEQNLVREIQQLQVSQEISQLHAEFTRRMQELEQILAREMKRLIVPSELFQIPGKIEQLRKQVEDLTALVSQISSVQANGEQKPINRLIDARIKAALAAINELGDDHANWLEQQQTSLQEMQPVIEELQKRHKASVAHIFPPEERQTDAIVCKF